LAAQDASTVRRTKVQAQSSVSVVYVAQLACVSGALCQWGAPGKSLVHQTSASYLNQRKAPKSQGCVAQLRLHPGLEAGRAQGQRPGMTPTQQLVQRPNTQSTQPPSGCAAGHELALWCMPAPALALTACLYPLQHRSTGAPPVRSIGRPPVRSSSSRRLGAHSWLPTWTALAPTAPQARGRRLPVTSPPLSACARAMPQVPRQQHPRSSYRQLQLCYSMALM